MTQQFHSYVYINILKTHPTNLKRYMHPNIHNSDISNRQDVEAT